MNISNIESIPLDCTLNCSLFVILRKSFKKLDPDDLLFGAFSDHIHAPYSNEKKRSRSFHLKKFKIVKKSNIISPNFIDSGADLLKFKFVNHDEILSDTMLDIYFKPQGVDSQVFNLRDRRTDNNGNFILTLPAGSIQIKYFGKDKVEVTKTLRKYVRGVIVNPELLMESTPVNMIDHCKELLWLDSTHPMDRPIIILGDISGSMATKNKLLYLKATFRRVLKDCLQNGLKVAFVTWNSWNYYCYPGGVLNQSEVRGDKKPTIQYITEKDSSLVNEWIKNIECCGGNNMRFAIEDSLRVYPDAKDVYTICDGDVRPFSIKDGIKISSKSVLERPQNRLDEAEPNTINWPHFRKIYPRVNFHFIALGKDAQHEEMSVMSSIGGGSFTSAII